MYAFCKRLCLSLKFHESISHRSSVFNLFNQFRDISSLNSTHSSRYRKKIRIFCQFTAVVSYIFLILHYRNLRPVIYKNLRPRYLYCVMQYINLSYFRFKCLYKAFLKKFYNYCITYKISNHIC